MKKKQCIRLVIADDHQIFLDGLILLFNHLDWATVCHSCCDGDALLASIDLHKPDIALIDLSMPGTSIETIISIVKQSDQKTKLIALTMLNNIFKAQELLELGLSGYILKDTAFEDLTHAIEDIINGKQFISSSLLEETDKQDEKTLSLTQREREVIALAAKGYVNKQIAYHLHITERTVCFHMANCFEKLGVSNRTEAIIKFLRNQITF